MKNELKETVKNITFAIVDGGRILMIQTALEYAGDELTEKNQLIELAKMTDQQLKHNLVSIMNYFLDNTDL